MDVRVPRVPRDPEIRRLRARVARAARYHPDQPELAGDDRRALKAKVAEQYVRDLVDSFPPLTDAQKGRLAALLNGTGGEDGAGHAS
jgi:hypothetical protein